MTDRVLRLFYLNFIRLYECPVLPGGLPTAKDVELLVARYEVAVRRRSLRRLPLRRDIGVRPDSG
jgi:hypothetical protein